MYLVLFYPMIKRGLTFGEGVPSSPGTPEDPEEKYEESPDNFLKDLLLVGSQKPLGYLPIDTLVDLCKVDLKRLQKELEGRGLKTVYLKEGRGRCNIASGALFAYDESALRALLASRKDVLRAEGWPDDPAKFVHYVATKYAKFGTPLFDLVADAFSDKNNRGRTDHMSKGDFDE